MDKILLVICNGLSCFITVSYTHLKEALENASAKAEKLLMADNDTHIAAVSYTHLFEAKKKQLLGL